MIEELFFKPENYNLIPLNTWSAKSKSPGVFMPAYQPPVNEYGHILGVDIENEEDDMTVVEVFKRSKIDGRQVWYSRSIRKVIPPHEFPQL